MFSFRETNNRVRLYFLGVPTGRKDNTLMYYDVTYDGKVQPWKQLLDLSEPPESNVTSLSKVCNLIFDCMLCFFVYYSTVVVTPITFDNFIGLSLMYEEPIYDCHLHFMKILIKSYY